MDTMVSMKQALAAIKDEPERRHIVNNLVRTKTNTDNTLLLLLPSFKRYSLFNRSLLTHDDDVLLACTSDLAS